MVDHVLVENLWGQCHRENRGRKKIIGLPAPHPNEFRKKTFGFGCRCHQIPIATPPRAAEPSAHPARLLPARGGGAQLNRQSLFWGPKSAYTNARSPKKPVHDAKCDRRKAAELQKRDPSSIRTIRHRTLQRVQHRYILTNPKSPTTHTPILFPNCGYEIIFQLAFAWNINNSL